MVWDESKHPRKENGEFTYKNGGDSNIDTKNDIQSPFKLSAEINIQRKSPADILYGDEKIKKEIEAKLSDYKSKLLDILDNFKTHADVLYSKIPELEEKIINNGLKYKLDKLKQINFNEFKNLFHTINSNKTLKEIAKFAIGENYNNYINNFAKDFSGKNTAGMLDLSHGINMNDRSYIKDVVHIDNLNDPKVSKDREYLERKLKEGFEDYNFDLNKIKGYNFPENSEFSKDIANSPDFHNILKKHKDEILSKGEFSDDFPKHIWPGIFKDSDLHNAIGMFDVKHATFDKEGNLHLKIYDTYDFNKGENALIQAGREEMLKGNLKPFFTINDIMIPKDKINEILR